MNQELKLACAGWGDTPHVRMRLLFSDAMAAEEQILSLTVTSGCCPGSDGPSLGGAVASSVTLKLSGMERMLEGELVWLEAGVEEEGITNWYPLGRYRLETPKKGDGVVTVTGVDAMLYLLEQGYYPSEPKPNSWKAVLQDICAQTGLELAPLEGWQDRSVTVRTGDTCRETVGYMAAVAGGNAVIDRQGRLAIRWFKAAGERIDPDHYYAGGLSRKDYDYALSGITVSVSEEEEAPLSIGTQGKHIRFRNPYMTQTKLERIWAQVGGFTYRPGEVSCLGRVWLEPGDLIQVTDTEGVTANFPVMAVEHSFDGGVKSKLTAYGSAEGDTSADFKGPATTALERYTASMASFQTLYTKELSAVQADVAELNAKAGHIENLDALSAHVAALEADKADVDLLNVQKADVQNLLVRGDLLAESVSGVEINASRYLTGVTVVGDVIEANTLSAKKLILQGEDGLLYELNAQAGTLSEAQLSEEEYQNRLDGSVLAAHSVTADRINVTDLFAQDITASGTIRGVALEGATGSFSGEVDAQRGSIGGFVVDSGVLYASGTHSVTGGTATTQFFLNGDPSQNEWSGEAPQIRFLGAYKGTPRAVSSWIKAAGGTKSGGTTSFDRLQLGTDAAGTASTLEVDRTGTAVNGRLTINGDASLNGKLYRSDGNLVVQCGTGKYVNVGASTSLTDAGTYRFTDSKVQPPLSESITTHLGDSTHRWGTIYAVNAVNTSSDRETKRDIESMDSAEMESFVRGMRPVSFYRKQGDRKHFGFIAQEVEDWLTANGQTAEDFAGFCKDAKVRITCTPEGEELVEELPGYDYSLRYEEFIAPLYCTVRNLLERVEELERKVRELSD